MKRRLTAWLTILAMVAGVVWPAHAAAHGVRPGDPAGDLCSAVKSAKTAPAQPAPALAEECAKCCACGDASAPAAAIGSGLPAAGIVAPRAASNAHAPRCFRGLARARGPPSFA